MPCFDAHIAEILVKDELDLGLGRRNIVRSREEIITYGMSYLMFRSYLTDDRPVPSVDDTEEPPWAASRWGIWVPTLC